MPGRIRAHYGDLGQASTAMANEAHAIQQMEQRIKSHVEGLHSKGWHGAGSDAFFNEMEHTVIPGIHKLHVALDTCSNVIKQITNIFQSAEQEVAQLFKKGGA